MKAIIVGVLGGWGWFDHAHVSHHLARKSFLVIDLDGQRDFFDGSSPVLDELIKTRTACVPCPDSLKRG